MSTLPNYLWVNPSSHVTYSSKCYIEWVQHIWLEWGTCSAYLDIPDCEAKEEDGPWKTCVTPPEGSLHYVSGIIFWFIFALTIRLCLFHLLWNTLWVMTIWNLPSQWQQNRFFKVWINYRWQLWPTVLKRYKLKHTLLFCKYLVVIYERKNMENTP